MPLSDEVRRVVDEVVRERFSGVDIVTVDVEEGEDHDGDSSLFVRIVFDADVDDLDAHRMVSITRHLWDRLNDVGEGRFPYTTFISKEDAEALA